MRDLEKFPAEENLRGRDHCLNDDIEKDDIDAVINTLKSDFLTQGPKVNEFECSISNYRKP